MPVSYRTLLLEKLNNFRIFIEGLEIEDEEIKKRRIKFIDDLQKQELPELIAFINQNLSEGSLDYLVECLEAKFKLNFGMLKEDEKIKFKRYLEFFRTMAKKIID